MNLILTQAKDELFDVKKLQYLCRCGILRTPIYSKESEVLFMKLIKKIIKVVTVSTLIMCMICTPVMAAEVSGDYTETIEADLVVQTRSISSTGGILLAKGTSFSESFNMKTGIFGLDTPHNAFNVKVHGITQGVCKIVISGSDGFYYESSEFSSDKTLTTSNAKSDVKYTVTFYAGKASDLAGKYAITSYIK